MMDQPTEEQQQDILMVLLIPYIIRSLEKDKLLIQKCNGMKFPIIYQEIIESIITELEKDIKIHKSNLRKNKIDIISQKTESNGLAYRYKYKRYFHDGFYVDYVLRNQAHKYIRNKTEK